MAEELSSVVYIGHLPKDFEEKELRAFCKQYDTVKNVQISRSPETGNSRCYGWVELETVEAAKLLASSLNNYLLFDKLLECKQLTKANVPPKLFTNARHGPKKMNYPELTKKEFALKLARQEKKIKATLAAKGINYEWPSLTAQFEKHGVPIPDEESKAEA